METFYDSVQLKSDTDKNVLSEKEVETIKELLSFSSLTSTDASTANINVDYDKRYKNRDMAYRLIQELNSKYADQLKQLNTKFAVYQGRKMSDVDIYLKIDVNNKMFNLEFWFGNELDNRAVDYMGLWANASNQQSRAFAIDWFKTNFPDYFSNAKYNNNKDDFAELFKKEFEKGLPLDIREQEFKEKAITILDMVLPKLLASKESL